MTAGTGTSRLPFVGVVRRVPWRRIGRAVAAAPALGLPVVGLAALVRMENGRLVALDEAAIRAGTDLTRRRPRLHRALVVWQRVFEPVWVNVAGLGLCVVVGRQANLRNRALWAFSTILTSWVLARVVKESVRRARPEVVDAVAVARGFSFPSSHVASASASAAALTVLAWPLLGPGGRATACAAGAGIVVLTAADRVMLGVHYPSDTAAGFAFGSAIVAASYRGYVGAEPVAVATDYRGELKP